MSWREAPAQPIIWRSNYAHPEGWKFSITHEVVWESVNRKYLDAFYLRVIDAEGYGKFDYMQDEFNIAVGQAFRKWGVPEDSWVKTNELEA